METTLNMILRYLEFIPDPEQLPLEMSPQQKLLGITHALFCLCFFYKIIKVRLRFKRRLRREMRNMRRE